jgi:hypothetical protein
MPNYTWFDRQVAGHKWRDMPDLRPTTCDV